MERCDTEGCDETLSNFSFTCSYCSKTFCSEHRLPEEHDCVWLEYTKTLGQDWRDVDFDAIQQDNDDTQSINNLDNIPPRPGKSKSNKKKCEKCSNYTTPENDLCLSCRRKERLIDSRSPDLKADGSIKPNSRECAELPQEGGGAEQFS